MRGIVHGRCKPCGLVYGWKPGPTRRLRMALCPRCKRALDQTCVANMKRPRFAKIEPDFRVVP